MVLGSIIAKQEPLETVIYQAVSDISYVLSLCDDDSEHETQPLEPHLQVADRHSFSLLILHIESAAFSRKAQVIAFLSFIAEIRGSDTHLWFNSFLRNETWVCSLDSNRFYFKEQTVLGNSGPLGEYHQGYSLGKFCHTLSRKVTT